MIGSQRGATAIEYSLVATLICIAIIGALTQVGFKVTALFDALASHF